MAQQNPLDNLKLDELKLKDIKLVIFDHDGVILDIVESVRKATIDAEKHLPIHRAAPSFTEQSTQTEVFETGIKVIDLICPFTKGGKVGLFGGAIKAMWDKGIITHFKKVRIDCRLSNFWPAGRG